MSFDSGPQMPPLGFVHVPDEHRAWLGNAEELAELANKIQRETGIDSGINERLVRYYVTMGVLDRPRRIGKEAQFSFRHLSQLIILRRMLDQGLSLGNVRQLFTTIPWDQIDPSSQGGNTAATDPSSGSAPTAAQLLVESFSQDYLAPRAVAPSHASQRPYLAKRSVRVEPRDARRLLLIPIGPGCDLMLEEHKAQRISPQSLEKFTETLRLALETAYNESNKGNP